MLRFTVLLLCVGALSACAKSSAEIRPSYVSPLQYQHYSCDQIAMEMQRVSSRATQVAGIQDGNATDDAIATTAAIIVFWPAAFLVGGDGQTGAELARLKGEFEALESISVQKNCRLNIRRNR